MCLQIRLIAVLIVAAVLAGSGAGAEEKANCKLTGDASKCGQCGMAMTGDGLRVGAYTRGSIPEWSFDDIGCMLLWRDAKCMPTQVDLDSHLYVWDFTSGDEVAATAAFFVVRSGVKTPMSHGIVGFATEAAARAFSVERAGSAVMTYEHLSEGDLAAITTR